MTFDVCSYFIFEQLKQMCKYGNGLGIITQDNIMLRAYKYINVEWYIFEWNNIKEKKTTLFVIILIDWNYSCVVQMIL